MYGVCAPKRRQSCDVRLPVYSSYGRKLSRVLLDCRHTLKDCEKLRVRYRTCQLFFKLIFHAIFNPISKWLAARSKGCVCGRSLAGIAGLNPVGGMDVCLEFCVLSGRGLCDGPIPRPGDSYRLFVCVCVCVSLRVIKCNSSPLHLLSVRRSGQTDKERKNLSSYTRHLHSNVCSSSCQVSVIVVRV
jgi:hypothetical protein